MSSCTIVNTRDTGSLKIIKLLDPNSDNGMFNLHINGPTGYTELNQGDNGTTGTQTVDTGEYTVSETAGDNTDVSNYASEYTCYDGEDRVAVGNGTQSTSFEVSKDHNIVCTFTNTRYGSISGYKYDANADGSTNGTLQGWTITLLVNGQSIATTQTDSDGHYSFDHLLPNLYSLVESFQDGWVTHWTQIFSPNDVTLSAGQNSTGNDFGNFKNGSIKGFKWNDLNGDGIRQKEEPKLSGWKITLTAENLDGMNYLQDGFNDSRTTNDNGYFHFKNLAPGIYTVCEVPQTGWVQTYPTDNNGCHEITIDQSNQQDVPANFGNQGRGTITVVKSLDDGFGNISRNVRGWTWDYAGEYQSDNDERARRGHQVNVAAGDYVVNEDQKNNYHFGRVACKVNGDTFDVDQQESIELSVAAGDDIIVLIY